MSVKGLLATVAADFLQENKADPNSTDTLFLSKGLCSHLVWSSYVVADVSGQTEDLKPKKPF